MEAIEVNVHTTINIGIDCTILLKQEVKQEIVRYTYMYSAPRFVLLNTY